jgi:hypothetical protein
MFLLGGEGGFLIGAGAACGPLHHVAGSQERGRCAARTSRLFFLLCVWRLRTIPSSLKERKERPFALGVWWRKNCFHAVSSIGTTRVIVPMQPSESAVTICKIMVGLRLQPEETSARNDVQSAFLGLGSERTPEEFSDGVTYAVAQEWVIEVNGDTLKISRTGFVVGSS